MKRLPCLLFIFCSTALASDAALIEEILTGIESKNAEPKHFTERRNSSLLNEPLVLSGEITFPADGVLTKRITQPFLESVVISGEYVELRRKGKTKRLSMNRRGDMRAFYTGMRALFNRDTETLLEAFDASTSVDNDVWTIDLIPKAAKLRKFLDRLSVSGRDSQILSVLTVQPGGDWQELSFNAAAD